MSFEFQQQSGGPEGDRVYDSVQCIWRFREPDILEAARNQDNFNQWEVGFNYWPAPNVVFKFDYRDRSHDLASQYGRDFTGFDVGVGYSF